MADYTCSVPACDKVAAVRGFCLIHYGRLRYAETHGTRPTWERVTPSCAFCGREVALREKGVQSKYCSATCKSKASYARRREAISATNRAANAERRALVVKTCPECGETFSPENDVRQKYCSKACGRRWWRNRRDKSCTVEGCDRPLRARGMCSKHYRRWERAAGRVPNEPWSDRRRAAYHKRRAMKKGVDAESVVALDVYERDGWQCGVCGGDVDPALSWPDPLSASLDHVVPLSRGGAHNYANVQLAHLVCNERKGCQVAA